MTEQERKAMQMALHGLLDAREVMILENNDKNAYQDEIEALRQALAQPEQEPIAFIEQLTGKPKLIGGYVVRTDADIPLYMTPSKREWVGLHLDDMPETYVGDKSFLHGAKWAEVKLKEKNT